MERACTIPDTEGSFIHDGFDKSVQQVWPTLTVADCLRNFLIDRYLEVSSFHDPKCWDFNTAFDYTVAFEAIRTFPVEEIHREHRSDIANRVSRIILHNKVPNLAMMTEHLSLLAAMTTIPNKFMHILTDTSDDGESRLGQHGGDFALITLARCIDDYVHWSVERIGSVAALIRLARSVMR